MVFWRTLPTDRVTNQTLIARGPLRQLGPVGVAVAVLALLAPGIPHAWAGFNAPLSFDNAGASFPYTVAVADFNGDGILDLAVANDGNNNVSVLLGKG